MEPRSSPPGGIISAGPDVEVVFAAPGWRAMLPRAEALARRAVALALADQGASGHVTVLLTDDAELRRLNGGFRGRDKPTNVLSFPAPYGALTLGDLAVSLGVLRREAAAEARGLGAHFAHLVVHGTLHLLGHDHLAAGQAAAMERAEARVLRRLGLPNPWRQRWRSAA